MTRWRLSGTRNHRGRILSPSGRRPHWVGWTQWCSRGRRADDRGNIGLARFWAPCPQLTRALTGRREQEVKARWCSEGCELEYLGLRDTMLGKIQTRHLAQGPHWPWTGLLEVCLKSRVAFLENPARKSMVLSPEIRTECRPPLEVCYQQKTRNHGWYSLDSTSNSATVEGLLRNSGTDNIQNCQSMHESTKWQTQTSMCQPSLHVWTSLLK